jgi:hypothetical protein
MGSADGKKSLTMGNGVWYTMYAEMFCLFFISRLLPYMPCGEVGMATGQLITSLLTKTADNHGRAYVWGHFFMLDKMANMVYNECNVFCKRENKVKGR